MAASTHILLVDDGELDDVASLLDRLEFEYTRLRGGEMRSDLPAPADLLIASPRRAACVRSDTPDGAIPGRPLRIIASEQDSNAMRQMLRRAGYHLLVRRPTHPQIWRLLIQRSMYQGDERRRDSRVVLGSDAQVGAASEDRLALIVDISSRGCRIASDTALSRGSAVALTISSSPADGKPIELAGEVVRCDASASDEEGFDSALSFTSIGEETQRRLMLLLEAVRHGPDFIAAPDAVAKPAESTVASEPADAIEASEGTVSANLEVCLRERRQQQRGTYRQSVLAEGACRASVLMGSDLSAGGMRVERMPDLQQGDRLTLAIYGPARAEPLRINAVVWRDDGEGGLALRFENVSDETARELEKLVAALPDVESLDRSESESMGTVLSEIVS